MAEPMLMTLRDLSEAVGGTLLSSPQGGEVGFSSVSIDSRTVAPGALFVALRGSVQDGHRFAAAAFAAGAAAALVDEEAMASEGAALRAAAEKTGGALEIWPRFLYKQEVIPNRL